MRTVIHVCVSAVVLVACALFLIPYLKDSDSLQQNTVHGYFEKASALAPLRSRTEIAARAYLGSRNVLTGKQRVAVLLTGEVTRLHTQTLVSFVIAPQVKYRESSTLSYVVCLE